MRKQLRGELIEQAFENLPLQASSAKYTVSYKQALGHISRFLEAFHACSREIRPLTEEDLLFLLLSRFAEQSDATVYVEIRPAHDLQVFDSTIIDPLVSSDKLLRNGSATDSSVSMRTQYKSI